MSARDIAERMAEAATRFLDALDAEQRSRAQLPFSDTTERETWFYTPTDHGGLPLSSMTPRQQKYAHMLLAEGLSHPGYNTAAAIIGLDNMLDRLEGFIRDWGRERGRDPGLYYWRVFGDPSGNEPWSWRVGGHHISVHFTIVDSEVVGSTPLFFGADPASAPLLGPTPHRPLGAVEDAARDLARSLNDGQQRLAIVTPVAPTDIVAANRAEFGNDDLPISLPWLWRGQLPEPWHELTITVQNNADGEAGITEESLDAVRLTHEPRGIAAADLDTGQQDALRHLLDLYAERLPGALADLEKQKYVGAKLDDHALLWAGSVEDGQGYYYRIQGPRLMVECDNTQRGANHIHSVWRDPSRDFGRDPLREHYRTRRH